MTRDNDAFADDWFKARVLRILQDHFGYAQREVRGAPLEKVCLTAREQAMNHYDAAVMYTMLQLSRIYETHARVARVGDEVREFVRRQTARILLLARREGRLSVRMLERCGLDEVIDDMRAVVG